MKKILTNTATKILIFILLIFFALAFVGFTPALLKDNVAYGDSYHPLDFTVDTNGYRPGSAVSGNSVPTFSLLLSNNSVNINDIKFYYSEQETGMLTQDQLENTWTPITDDNTADRKVDFSLSSLVTNNTFYHQFLYFKVEYIDKRDSNIHKDSFEVIVDSLTNPNYSILSHEVSKYVNGTYYIYDGGWVSSSLKIVAHGADPTIQNKKYYYSFGENGAKHPMDVKKEQTGEYYAEVILDATLFKSLDIEGFAGEIFLHISDFNGQNINTYHQSISAKLDFVAPQLDITSNKRDTGENYTAGQWSNQDIVYNITISKFGESGVTLEYQLTTNNVTGEWLTLTDSNNIYTLIITESSSVRFRATSGASLEHLSSNYTVNIDKISPNLILQAMDLQNKVVANNGFANDLLKVTMINGINSNGSISPITNKAPLFFEYKLKDAGDDAYIQANESGGNRVAELFAPIKFGTYIFRIRSATGVISSQEFTVSVIKSDFSLEVDELDISEISNNGWIFEKVPVYITLDNILNTSDEYSFSYYYDSESNLKQVLPQDRVLVGDKGEKAKYLVYIDSNVNSKKIIFKIQNRAGSIKEYTIPINLSIDLSKPKADVKKQISGSPVTQPIYLEADDWANGPVIISLNINNYINISGVKAYILTEGTEGLIVGRELIAKNGIFEQTVSDTGRYLYRLTSGSGISTDIEVVINIEKLSTITLQELIFPSEIKVDTSTSNVVKPLKPLSESILIDFVSNQYGHYNIWFYEFTDSINETFPNGYTKAPLGNEYLLNIPHGKNSKKISFVLESKAINANGEKAYSAPIILEYSYDSTSFEIELETLYKSGEWVFDGIDFTLINENLNEEIVKYQYMLKPALGNWSQIWIDIPVDNSSNINNFTFTFSGVDRFVNNAKIGSSFNGNILFRAIKDSGQASNQVGESIIVRVDTCSIDITQAIYLQKTLGTEISDGIGEIVNAPDTDTEYDYYVYNEGDIFLRLPNYESDPILSQFAPLIFKYSTTAPNPDTMSDLDLSSVSLSGKYYIYAKHRNGAKSELKTFSFVKDNGEFNGDVSAIGGATDNNGIYIFNWATEALISFNVTSLSDIYYWYQLDGGEWQRYENSATANNNLSMKFSNNMNSTVKFAITNRSGREYIFTSNIMKIKIDTSNISFLVHATNNGGAITPEKWYNSAIDVEIERISTNPSGVEFTYSTDRITYSKLPDNGRNKFSSDLINAANTPEGITIYIRGSVNAKKPGGGQNSDEVSLVIKVDKSIPKFTLSGLAIRSNSQSSGSDSLVSGDWTNADSVQISKHSTAVDSFSKITYVFYRGINSEPNIWNDDTAHITSSIIELITVEARNEAGTIHRETFQVNIDKVAPIIISGNINNNYLDDGTIDYQNLNSYYIDQQITYIEENLKEARFNNFTLSNGQIIATDKINNDDGGKVHIIITDNAGNKAELVFRMIPFELDVNTITLSTTHIDLLESYEDAYNQAKGTLTQSRDAYFRGNIARLYDRIRTLEKQVNSYRDYLAIIQSKVSFELKSDYAEMHTFINYFESNDSTVRYPEWQQAQILEGEYSGYYAKLKTEYDKLNKLMNEIRLVEQATILLPAMNIVKRTDYQNILSVYNAYQSLSRDQQSTFNTNLYVKLTEVKRRCELLRLQDPTTGISISGDDLSPDIMIVVNPISRTTDLFINTQFALFQTIPEDQPRAILTINQIGIKSDGSNQVSGRVLMHLPIPDAYQNYISFAVYTLAPDGTIIKINDTTINGDKQSVYFYTDSLDTKSYVLTTKANVTVRPPKSDIYGVIGGIEIDAKMLMYITFAVSGVFIVFVLITIFAGVRRKKFLAGYNRKHKDSLTARGIDRIPKGNKKPNLNPLKPEERSKYNKRLKK